MHQETKFKISIKKETLLSAAGIVWLLVVFIFQWNQLQAYSPFALLVITLSGFVISFKFKLAGGILILFGGLALAVHPFMFSSSLWLLPGAVSAGLGGFIQLVNWWQQNED